jgi:hypothetical protein
MACHTSAGGDLIPYDGLTENLVLTSLNSGDPAAPDESIPQGNWGGKSQRLRILVQTAHIP